MNWIQVLQPNLVKTVSTLTFTTRLSNHKTTIRGKKQQLLIYLTSNGNQHPTVSHTIDFLNMDISNLWIILKAIQHSLRKTSCSSISKLIVKGGKSMSTISFHLHLLWISKRKTVQINSIRYNKSYIYLRRTFNWAILNSTLNCMNSNSSTIRSFAHNIQLAPLNISIRIYGYWSRQGLIVELESMYSILVKI